jgi:hypothetical protein
LIFHIWDKRGKNKLASESEEESSNWFLSCNMTM